MSSKSLFRPYIRFDNAKRLVEDYSLSSGDHALYAVIGREADPQGEDPNGVSYDAGDGLWPNSDQDVPEPEQTIQEDREFWSMAIGAQKLDPRDLSMVVPREDWTENHTDYVAHPLFDDSVSYDDGGFYVLNSNDEIFVCVDVETPGAPSTVEPDFTSATTLDTEYFDDGLSSIQEAADGYTWKFVAKIRSYEVENIMGEFWMPVPYGDTLVQPDSDPYRTRGRDDAYWILGARWVMIRAKMSAATDGSALPANLTYRQIMFVSDPVEKATGDPATESIYLQRNTVVAVGDDELEKESGRILYRENRGAISRDEQQTEEIRTVIVL